MKTDVEQGTVGVVIPVYNRRVTVIEALQCVAAQTVTPRVLVVVDDGSTDGTADAVRRWIERTDTPFPTKLICQPNCGASAARNRGSKAADHCELLAFLDSDDLWPLDFLERTTRAMRGRPDAVAATCDEQYACFDDCGHALFRSITQLDTSGLVGNATEWLFLANRGITPATVVRADVFRRIGRYDETLVSGEDWKLYLHLSLLGPWLHVPGDPVTVRLGICKTRREESHLQLVGQDRYYLWASIVDRFIPHEGGKHAIRRRVYSRRLASLWYAIGRSMMNSGRNQLARQCFRRSVSWRAAYPKAWFRLVRSYLPQAA
jgi:glycosyltransferase involved in cell wall biosynthesis